MKTEGAFNAYLTKEFNKYKPNVYAVKLADKYKAGLSDFIIWMDKTSIALESKNVANWNDKGKLLTHEFSPTQLSFFKKFMATNCKAFGLIAFDNPKLMFLVPADVLISLNGNLSGVQLLENGKPFQITTLGVEGLIDYIKEVCNGRR